MDVFYPWQDMIVLAVSCQALSFQQTVQMTCSICNQTYKLSVPLRLMQRPGSLDALLVTRGLFVHQWISSPTDRLGICQTNLVP